MQRASVRPNMQEPSSPTGLLAAFGRFWEFVKALGVVLWPIRFIVLVMLAMFVILALPQALDAFYGALAEEGWGRWIAVFLAVTAWALQSWYWARFLLDRVPLRGFPMPLYIDPTTRRLDRFVNWLKIWLPRGLGSLIFIAVGLYALFCGAGWFTVISYFAVAGVFLYFTVRRRRSLERRGAARATVLPPAPASLTKIALAAALAWIVLLGLTTASAVIEFLPAAREGIALLIVGLLALTSAMAAGRLPLEPSTRLAIAIIVGINTVLFVASILLPAPAGMWLGPAVVLMLTAGAWVGASSFFFALPGERLRLPMTTMVFIAALLGLFLPKFLNSAGDFDNHRVRVLGSTPADDKRAGLEAAFAVWKRQAPAVCRPGGTCVKPMILVAAEGGASRSGYWVATVLGALEDAVGGFHRSVFAISGVSGGALGTAVYQRLVARRQAAKAGTSLCGEGSDVSNSFAVCGQRVLDRDFLGPVFFSMFNADLLQRLLPGDVMPDRAEALETAWERAWRDVVGTDDFAEQFRVRSSDELARDSESDWLPIVFLNGASVKTGRRIVTADIAVEPKCQSADSLNLGPDLPSTVDFFCLTRREIRLSTAVHNSARFPYISPAGTLWADDGEGHSWKADRIVDGGYVEAQGATTLHDLLITLAGKVTAWDDHVLPILITIQNDPPQGERVCTPGAECSGRELSKQVGDEAGIMSGLMQAANDFLAPPIGLAASRTGRGAYAARALEVGLYYGGRHQGERLNLPPEQWQGWPAYRFNLLGGDGPAPAMSWYLSQRSRRDMAGDLCGAPGVGNREGTAAVGKSLCQLGQNLPPPQTTTPSPQGQSLSCDSETDADRHWLPTAIRSGPGCKALPKKMDALPGG